MAASIIRRTLGYGVTASTKFLQLNPPSSFLSGTLVSSVQSCIKTPLALHSQGLRMLQLPIRSYTCLASTPSILKPTTLPCVTAQREVTKFSLRTAKRKSVKTVLRRFFRLHCGMWIRPVVGRAKRLWKKSPKQRQHLQEHVFCEPVRNRQFDKMCTKYWKKRRYYIDDPYEPYHTRFNINIANQPDNWPKKS